MQWSQSETLALAAPSCSTCRGLGMTRGRRAATIGPCKCVLRAIFRSCYERFRYLSGREKTMCRVTLAERRTTGVKAIGYGRKNEEYCADFFLVARRALTAPDWNLFRHHFLAGRDSHCAALLGLSHGNYFHAVYRIEATLGRVFRETAPYSLYPLSEYFSNAVAPTAPAPGASAPPPARSIAAAHVLTERGRQARVSAAACYYFAA